MFPALQGFDPIIFLNINKNEFSPEELEQLRQDLNNKIGEYVLLKLSSSLTEEQMNQVLSSKNEDEMIQILSSSIPDLENKVLIELENFKTEYNNVKE